MLDSFWPLVTTPWSLAPDTLLGATLLAVLAALVGEAVWRVLRWPRVVGYALVGTALALAGRGAEGDEPALRVAIDGALALLLFEAGARLKLRWLARNPWLLATSVAEALLTGIAVFVTLRFCGLAAEVATPLAIVAVCVSPAVLQRVVGELHAAGQVTERLLALAALNTLYAVLAMKLLSAGLLLSDPTTWLDALSPVLFSFCGSILLGAALGEGLALIARRFDLREDNSMVLLLAFVLLALVVAKTLQFSALLVPLLAGMWLANRSERPWIWPRHFGSAGSVLVLVMFVAVSSAWNVAVLQAAAGVAAALVVARALAKGVAVVALARPSGLSLNQAVWLSTGLTPMSATAWVLTLDFAARHPALGTQLMPVLLASLALLELAAPLAVMGALRAAGEVDAQPVRRENGR
ncbi:MAG TPA: cation:proton antiporter [Burkholderiaceae bacterium]|nr:cation:proton antiporter [Burkholderiaceae bacterium]